MSLEIMSRDVAAKFDSFKKEEFQRVANELEGVERESVLRLDTFKLENYSKFQKEVEILKSNIVGSAKSEAKSILLKSQREVFDKLKIEVLNNFKNLEGPKRKDFYMHLLNRAQEIISVDLISCSKDDLKIVQSLIDKKVDVKISNLVESGLIFESIKNKESLDLRVEVILNSILKEKEEEIVKLLLN